MWLRRPEIAEKSERIMAGRNLVGVVFEQASRRCGPARVFQW
jgi:hypothetical protein